MEAVLAPWLADAALSLEIDALPSARDLRDRLWVDVALARSEDRWTQQLEALKLLAVALRVDSRAAWTALLAAGGKWAYVDEILAAETPLRFRLVVHSSVYTNDVAFAGLRDALLRLTTPRVDEYQQMPYYSDEFVAAKRELQELTHAHGGVRSMRDDGDGFSPVALCLKQHEQDVPFQRPSIPDMLTRLVALAESISPSNSSSSEFQWTHIVLNCQNTDTLDVLFDRVGRLFQCGLQVELLTITQRAPLVDAAAAAQFWAHALASGGVQSLTLSTAMDAAAFRGLCSAIATSQAPLEVSYWPKHGLDNDVDARSNWRWLALALFRPLVRREELRVALDLSGLTLEEAHAIERVVRAQDPFAVLRLQDDRTPAPVYHSAEIRPGTSIAIGDRPTSHIRAEVPDTSLVLRVMDDATVESHVAVWWPGAGIGWVHEADIIARHESTQVQPAVDATLEAVQSIDHLNLRLSSTTAHEAAAVLLRAIGPSVRRLTVHCEYAPLVDEAASGFFWSNLLLAFPALERLDLSYAALDNLAWLLEASTCRLRVLSLDGVYMEDPERCLGGLFDALVDRNHALSHSLREFHTQWVTVEPCLDKLLSMLAANRSLEKCILSTESDPSEWHEMRIPEFTSHSVSPWPPEVEKRRRLAFLSVSRAYPDTETGVDKPHVARFLDEHALALVLAFDETKRRQCDVVYREW